MTRRVITAREQVELLARWRRTAGWADWKVTARYPSFGPDAATHEARLENGHTMMVSSGQWGHGPANIFWDYHIADQDENTLGYGGSDESGRPEHPIIRSAEEAKQKAEDHYRHLFPVGTNTGKHDSGVDYSDLNKFMGEL
jgi:hypothetical protein